MKKILLSLLFVVAGITAMTAGTATFDLTSGYENAQEVTTLPTKDGITITFGSGQNTSNKPLWYTTGTGVRTYKQNTIDIVSASGNITSVKFTFSGASYTFATAFLNGTAPAPSIFSTGSYSESELIGTWTGGATSLNIVSGGATATKGSARIQKIEVTYGGVVTQVSTPTFSPKGGTYYEAQTVKISCATEGAVIKYSVDGGSTQVTYTQPIVVDKTTTIVAQATKTGLESSDIAEETFTISAVPTVANIAAYLALEKDALAKITGNVTVIYQNGKYLFVKDNSGALQIYGDITKTYKNGDVLSGIIGTVGEYGGLKQMVPTASSFGDATEGTLVTPKIITANQAESSMSNQLVKIYNTSITTPDPEKAKNFNVTDITGTLAGYNRFTGVTVPTDDKKYDVLGILNQYNTTTQIFVIEFSEYTGVDGVDADATTSIVPSFGTIDINAAQAAQATVVNAAGQVVAQKMITEGNNTISVAPGFYIVKVGTTVAKVIVK